MKGQKIGTRLGITAAIAVFLAAAVSFMATFFLLKLIIDDKDEDAVLDDGSFVVSEMDHLADEMKLTTYRWSWL